MWSHNRDDVHQKFDNNNSNSPQQVPYERINGQYMPFGQGQFGDLCTRRKEPNKPFVVPNLSISSSTLELLPELSGELPASVKAFYAPQDQDGIRQRQPVNVSHLTCPIMMLKNSSGKQGKSQQKNEFVPHQHISDTSGQIHDRENKIQQGRPGLEPYNHTEGSECNSGTCSNSHSNYPHSSEMTRQFVRDFSDCNQQHIQADHKGKIITDVNGNRQYTDFQRTDHMPGTANSNFYFQPISSQQRQLSTEEEYSQHMHQEVPFNIINHQTESYMFPQRQYSQINMVSFYPNNNPNFNFNPNVHGGPQNIHPGTNIIGRHFSESNGVSALGINYCQYKRPTGGSYNDINIHEEEKSSILACMRPHCLVQVCGPPMAGKSTLVRQAMRDTPFQHQFNPLYINCKNVTDFKQFLKLIYQKFCPQKPINQEIDEDDIQEIIKSVIQQNHFCFCALVLNKCENFRDVADKNQFLNFLVKLTAECPIAVVFTTYKLFVLPPACHNELITVGTLNNFDIIRLLQHYSPGVDYASYAAILVKVFCFPETVRVIAEEFIADIRCRLTPEMLEKKINRDENFLSQLFENHVHKVSTWIPTKVMSFLTHFGHSVDNSFTEAHLIYVNNIDIDPVDLKKIIRYLEQNHIVRLLPVINRLVIHPLAVYYWMTVFNQQKKLLPLKWVDSTFNRNSYFLGRILMNIEANMHCHGRWGFVFSGFFDELANVRYLIQKSLTCNTNTYRDYVKIAASASEFIFKFFPKEAESFYYSLYVNARNYGSKFDLAVMEAFLGQAIAVGAGNEWSRADKYLSSAVQHLQQFGNSFYLGWTLTKLEINQHRQGKYEKCLMIGNQAKNVLQNVDRLALGEDYYVSETRVEEEKITQEIHETIPIIFTGHNNLARHRLNSLLDIMTSNFENHPELATVYNLVGLTEERGNRDLKHALRWYNLSYNERMYYAKTCPEKLLAVLNNIAMILSRQGDAEGCIKQLQKALDIQREFGWTHYYTALTLIHLAEVHMKNNNIMEAFKRSLEAERIFAAAVVDHDVRLRANSVLAHLRIAVRHMLEGSQDEEYGISAEANQCPRQFLNCQYAYPEMSMINMQENCARSSQFAQPCESCTDQTHRANNDLLSVTTMIEPCDLQRTAEDYFRRILSIVDNMKGTISDDGHSHLLNSLEHLILLNCNNPIKYEEYRNAFLKCRTVIDWLEINDATNEVGFDSNFRCLTKHKNICLYIMNTEYPEFDAVTFINFMQEACLTCSSLTNIFNKNFWVTEVQHCKQKMLRAERYREIVPFECLAECYNNGFEGNVQCVHERCTADALKFDELSQFNVIKQSSGKQLHVSDMFKSVQHAANLESKIEETHDSCISIVSSKIASDQMDILKKIQRDTQPCPCKTFNDCKMLSHSKAVCGGETMNCRVPVEVSYNDTDGDYYDIKDVLSKSDLQEKNFTEKPNKSSVRSVDNFNDNNISQLKNNKYQSDQTLHKCLSYDNQKECNFIGADNKVNMFESDVCKQVKENSFSVSDYIRNALRQSLTVNDKLQSQISESSDKSGSKLLNQVQDNSKKYQLLNVKNVTVYNSQEAVDVVSKPVLCDTTSYAPASTQENDSTTKFSLNCHKQVTNHKSIQSRNEPIKTQHMTTKINEVVSAQNLEHIDSGLDPLQRNPFESKSQINQLHETRKTKNSQKLLQSENASLIVKNRMPVLESGYSSQNKFRQSSTPEILQTKLTANSHQTNPDLTVVNFMLPNTNNSLFVDPKTSNYRPNTDRLHGANSSVTSNHSCTVCTNISCQHVPNSIMRPTNPSSTKNYQYRCSNTERKHWDHSQFNGCTDQHTHGLSESHNNLLNNKCDNAKQNRELEVSSFVESFWHSSELNTEKNHVTDTRDLGFLVNSQDADNIFFGDRNHRKPDEQSWIEILTSKKD